MKKEFRNFENETDILKCITRSNQHQKRFESSQICPRVPCRPSSILLKFSMIKSFVLDGLTYDLQVVIIDGRIVQREYSGPVRSQRWYLFFQVVWSPNFGLSELVRKIQSSNDLSRTELKNLEQKIRLVCPFKVKI